MSHGVNIADKTDRQLADLQTAILKEQALRRRLDVSPEKIENAISEYQKSMGREDGEQWKQPSGALDSYPHGSVVTYDGARYRSTTAANVWEPPVGWRLMPETDDQGREIPPPYVAPSGAHDSYNKGERVTFDGEVWEAVRDGVVHSPAEYAADWKHIIPATPIEPAEPIEPDPEPEPPEDDEGEPELPDNDQPAEWVQPTSAADAYNTGDAVTYQNAVYISLMDGNVWSPSAHPQGWEKGA